METWIMSLPSLQNVFTEHRLLVEIEVKQNEDEPVTYGLSTKFNSIIQFHICLENLLQIIVKTSVAEFMFSKIPWFLYILFFPLNFFFEAHLILDDKAAFRLQKPRCKDFWWKRIKNQSCKSHLRNKEQKAMSLVVSQLDVHLGFENPFFCVPDRARK